MVLRKMWVLGNIGFHLGSVFDGSRSLVFLRFSLLGVLNVFADGSWSLGFVILHFRLVFRSRIFQSSWVQLIELNL